MYGIDINSTDELARLDELDSFEILNTPPERDYDDISHLASIICDTPIALITLLNEDKQWFKSKVGIAIDSTHRNMAFCNVAIQDKKILIVEDALKDSRFSNNELVQGEPNIRFYAGVPLITARNHALGTLCVIDTCARKLNPVQIKALETLANQVVTHLELRRNQKQLQKHLRQQQQTLKALQLAKEEQETIQTGINKIAAGIARDHESSFFEDIAIITAEALKAEVCFVGKFIHHKPTIVQVVGGVVDGKLVENFEYFITDTPCENLLLSKTCVIPKEVCARFPKASALSKMDSKGYIGTQLLDTENKPIGLIFVIYKEEVKRTDYIISTLQIIADRVSTELLRRSAEKKIADQANLLDKANDAIIEFGLNREVLFWNKSAERVFGWTRKEALENPVGDEMHRSNATLTRLLDNVLLHGEYSSILKEQTKANQLIDIETHWTLVNDENGNPKSVLAIKADISNRVASEKEINHLAYYDDLTSLPNRRLLYDRFKLVALSCERKKCHGALLMLDLDRFKDLNDTHGHDIGDLLLKKVAKMLTNCLRKTDTICRFGGDEFVLLISELSSNRELAEKHVAEIATKILTAFKKPFNLFDFDYSTTASIGISVFINASKSIDTVIKHADLAMYQSKESGRNCFKLFSEDMNIAINNRIDIEQDLRDALKFDQFRLHYQLQLNRQQKVIGAEALIRWQHPKKGLIYPNDFIPIAENIELIFEIGQSVIKQACHQLVQWQANPETNQLTIAVNVSVKEFKQLSFVNSVKGIIIESGCNPSFLRMELTESLLVDDIEETIRKMQDLKAIGVRFSLDDFGTGYSSLMYLKRLPIDELKIDQSFVRDLLTDTNDSVIAQTIISLAENMGLTVIAEGVETQEQFNMLLQMGCQHFQGYLFSKPAPIEKINQLLLTSFSVTVTRLLNVIY